MANNAIKADVQKRRFALLSPVGYVNVELSFLKYDCE